MNKLLGDKLIKEKQTIKNRYLAGEAVPSIARSYDVTERNIYYHLGVLSPDEKGLHIKNSSLRKMTIKKDPLKISTSTSTRPSTSNVIPEPIVVSKHAGRVAVCAYYIQVATGEDMCKDCGHDYQAHLDSIKGGI